MKKAKKVNGVKYLIFDTETTGLVKPLAAPIDQQPDIIEYFGMSLELMGEEWIEHKPFESLFHPRKPIDAEITRITGLTNDDLRGAPLFRDRADDLRRFIQSHDVVVAHNLSFDMDMVNFEFQRLSKDLEWPARRICTVEATEHLKGHRLSLTALHEHLFGEPFTGAHRARIDVEALGRCLVALHERGEI